jgi:hypothetical protein
MSTHVLINAHAFAMYAVDAANGSCRWATTRWIPIGAQIGPALIRVPNAGESERQYG